MTNHDAAPAGSTEHGSAESTTRFDVTLTERQVRTVLAALYERSVEFGRYVSPSPGNLEPGALDTCCDGHRAQFERRISERTAAAEQYEHIHALINLVEGLEARP